MAEPEAAASATANAGWEDVGPGSASGGGISNTVRYSEFPSLAIDPDGVPIVAWQDDSSGNDEIYVRRYAGEQNPPLPYRFFIPTTLYTP